MKKAVHGRLGERWCAEGVVRGVACGNFGHVERCARGWSKRRCAECGQRGSAGALPMGCAEGLVEGLVFLRPRLSACPRHLRHRLSACPQHLLPHRLSRDPKEFQWHLLSRGPKHLGQCRVPGPNRLLRHRLSPCRKQPKFKRPDPIHPDQQNRITNTVGILAWAETIPSSPGALWARKDTTTPNSGGQCVRIPGLVRCQARVGKSGWKRQYSTWTGAILNPGGNLGLETQFRAWARSPGLQRETKLG